MKCIFLVRLVKKKESNSKNQTVTRVVRLPQKQVIKKVSGDEFSELKSCISVCHVQRALTSLLQRSISRIDKWSLAIWL